MGSWRAFLVRTWDLHVLVLVLVIALAVQFADAQGVTTDGVIYFSQLRSAIFDHDLDVAAEFAYLQQPPRPSHVVPIGPTLVWLPSYLVVAAVDGSRLVNLLQTETEPRQRLGNARRLDSTRLGAGSHHDGALG